MFWRLLMADSSVSSSAYSRSAPIGRPRAGRDNFRSGNCLNSRLRYKTTVSPPISGFSAKMSSVIPSRLILSVSSLIMPFSFASDSNGEKFAPMMKYLPLNALVFSIIAMSCGLATTHSSRGLRRGSAQISQGSLTPKL